jgi:hypothetical protein
MYRHTPAPARSVVRSNASEGKKSLQVTSSHWSLVSGPELGWDGEGEFSKKAVVCKATKPRQPHHMGQPGRTHK